MDIKGIMILETDVVDIALLGKCDNIFRTVTSNVEYQKEKPLLNQQMVCITSRCRKD